MIHAGQLVDMPHLAKAPALPHVPARFDAWSVLLFFLNTPLRFQGEPSTGVRVMPVKTDDDILDKLFTLAALENRPHRALLRAASATMDKYAAQAWRDQLKEIDSLWTRKGDRRSIATVEKGKKTFLRNRRRRARARGNERRAIQSAELGDRRFHRELSATAILLRALEPDRWYVRSEIRAACPELPRGTLDAQLGRQLLTRPALLERAPNLAYDGLGGVLRGPRPPERRSRWLYRLSDAGKAARAEIETSPEKWSARSRWRAGLNGAIMSTKIRWLRFRIARGGRI